MLLCVLCLFPVVSAFGQNLLHGAESVDFDIDRNRYMVSSYYDGNVVAIDSVGIQSLYKTDLGRTYGLTISQGVLYVSTGLAVKAYDLSTDELLWDIVFTSGLVQGVGCDGDGYLYAIDNLGRIIKMDLSTRTQQILVSSGLPVYPQDVAYDPVRDRLLAVGYDEGSLVVEIDRETGAVSPAAAFAYGIYDGISCDHEGNAYLSSDIGNGFLLKWDGEYAHTPAIISSDHDEPAGNCVNERDSIIALCNFASSSVDFISYTDRDHDNVPVYGDNCPDTYNPGQEDADNDLAGDACDACTDTDLDGYGDPGYAASTCEQDNCPDVFNDNQADGDGDGVGDGCDNCPDEPNPDQLDLNGNLIGDACEGCCTGRVGDANGQAGDEPTIGDVSIVIDALFITGSGEVLSCLTEADVNQSGGSDPTFDDVTIGDVSVLIDYLFIAGPQLVVLPECL